MKVIKTISEMRETVQCEKDKGRKIGFVSTMGSLHEGHMSLVRAARDDCDYVVVSIFVNPIQFSAGEDLDDYPRDLNRDTAMLEEAGVDCIFAPDEKEMYPTQPLAYVEVEALSKVLCGQSRKTFFRGVTTVVSKLFSIVQPDRAYFGEKDYQQLVIVKRMVKDLHIPVEIIGCPTVRERDGLAMSSRNSYLSETERTSANVVYRALRRCQDLLDDGVCDAEKLCGEAEKMIHIVNGTRIDYISLVDPETLEELGEIEDEGRMMIAIWLGSTRLIDNAQLRVKKAGV